MGLVVGLVVGLDVGLEFGLEGGLVGGLGRAKQASDSLTMASNTIVNIPEKCMITCAPPGGD